MQGVFFRAETRARARVARRRGLGRATSRTGASRPCSRATRSRSSRWSRWCRHGPRRRPGRRARGRARGARGRGRLPGPVAGRLLGSRADGRLARRLRSPQAHPRRPRASPAAQLGAARRSSAAVGASGYVVNLVVYTALLNGAGLHYAAAATCSFLVAVTNNYLWNRLWTFRAPARPRRLPGPALPRRLAGRARGEPRAADACSSRSASASARPGDRDRARHAAELHRQQALVVSARA